MLNYRPSRARGVEVVDELPAEVFRILVRERKAMTFKAAPEGAEGDDGGGWLLDQPEEEDGGDGPAARHVDLHLQTSVSSSRLHCSAFNCSLRPANFQRLSTAISCVS